MNRRDALAATGTALTAALGSLTLTTIPAALALPAKANGPETPDRLPTVIESLAEAWQMEVEGENYEEYRRLQIAIGVAEPTSLRDLALQYWVDTDMGASCESDRFQDRLARLADWDGLMRGGLVAWQRVQS